MNAWAEESRSDFKPKATTQKRSTSSPASRTWDFYRLFGERRWVLITKDKNVRRNQLEENIASWNRLMAWLKDLSGLRNAARHRVA